MPKRRARPRYLAERRNRDGRIRFYWAPPGQPPRRLPDDPAAAWPAAEALNRTRDLERAGVAGRGRAPREGTLAALIADYRSDPDFRALAAKTRKGYEAALVWLEGLAGDLSPAAIGPAWVQAAKRAGEAVPFQTNARLRVVRILYGWAKRNGRVAENPAAGFRQLAAPARRVVWSAADVRAFLEAARPSLRLAVLLGVYTLQREGDLLVLPWHAYDGQRLELRQRKTGRLVACQVAAPLKAALDVTPRRAVSVLVSERTGRPFDEHHFRHAFDEDRRAAGLPASLQFRDLRRTGAVMLARMGIALQAIAALGGWSISRTSKILETYVPLDSAMADLAVAAMERSGPDFRTRPAGDSNAAG